MFSLRSSFPSLFSFNNGRFSIEIREGGGRKRRFAFRDSRVGAAAEQSFFNGDPFSEGRPTTHVDDATYFSEKGARNFARRLRDSSSKWSANFVESVGATLSAPREMRKSNKISDSGGEEQSGGTDRDRPRPAATNRADEREARREFYSVALWELKWEPDI